MRLRVRDRGGCDCGRVRLGWMRLRAGAIGVNAAAGGCDRWGCGLAGRVTLTVVWTPA
jgi:hypothetical protein